MCSVGLEVSFQPWEFRDFWCQVRALRLPDRERTKQRNQLLTHRACHCKRDGSRRTNWGTRVSLPCRRTSSGPSVTVLSQRTGSARVSRNTTGMRLPTGLPLPANPRQSQRGPPGGRLGVQMWEHEMSLPLTPPPHPPIFSEILFLVQAIVCLCKCTGHSLAPAHYVLKSCFSF